MLSGREKATIFLSIVGADASAKVLKYLPSELADLIASGINNLPTPSPEMVHTVLNEFTKFAALPAPKFGSEPIRQLQSAPVSHTQMASPAPEIKQIVRKSGGSIDDILYASPKKISYVLAHERPQIKAFVLSYFPPNQRAEILTFLPDERNDVEKMISQIKSGDLSDKIRGRVFDVITKRMSNI